MDEERRLSFGAVAERYDRSRPSYPPALVEDVLDFAAAGAGTVDRALEIGAGTGKATVPFAQRGVSVVALEPSAEMAAIARRNCAAYPNVTIEQTEFERWDPDGETFRLVFSAQAWHWISPDVRYVRAREALEPGGGLAAFWNVPDWPACELRDALGEVYRRHDHSGHSGDPMNPNTRYAGDDWAAEVARASGFTAAQTRRYHWESDYTTEGYLDLLATHSAVLVLAPAHREALLSDILSVLDAHGGAFRMNLVTLLCLARAS